MQTEKEKASAAIEAFELLTETVEEIGGAIMDLAKSAREVIAELKKPSEEEVESYDWLK